MSARRSVAFAVVAALATARGGAAGSHGSGASVRVLERLADVPHPAFVTGQPVTIADEIRRALRTAAVTTILAQPVPGRDGASATVYRGSRAASSPHAGALLVLPPATDRKAGRLLLPALVRPAPGRGTVLLPASHVGAEWRTSGMYIFRARPLVDPERLDTTTQPIQIPSRARLEFAVGVEEDAWHLGATGGPVAFTVTALDGDRSTPLAAVTVHPGRPGDRRWIEHRVDLGPLAGRTVRLRFAARPVEARLLGTSLPVFAAPEIVVDAPDDPEARPNVVLVSLDTLRARSVGTYGGAPDASPRLDAFARESVLFEDASAAAPHTLTSHITMLTGLLPRSHRGAPLAQTHAFLAEHLHAAGFATAAFTENALLIPTAGIARGFDVYRENKADKPYEATTVGRAHETLAAAVAWLRRHHRRRFFLFLHTYEVHWPYVAPTAYAGHRSPAGLGTLGANLELLYDRELRYLDDEVGAFLDELDALGVADRTLVVITADHGEEFHEHGRLFHGHQLYEETIRVPLVVRWPGALPAGRRIRAPVSLADLTPTVLDLLGLRLPPGMDGTSLAPHVLAGTPLPDRGVPSECGAAADEPPHDLVAVRTATTTCIHRSHTDALECFDRRADPFERVPLASHAAPEVAATIAHLVRHNAVGAAAGRLVAPSAGVDPGRARQLRALGYID